MNKWIKSLCAFSLACVCTFLLCGCGGKTVTDLDGNKFGKQETITSAEIPATASFDLFGVTNNDTADTNSISITCTSNVTANIKVGSFSTKVYVNLKDNFIYDSVHNQYYYDTYQYSKINALIVNKERTDYGYSALKDGKLYSLYNEGSKKSVADLLAVSPVAHSETVNIDDAIALAQSNISSLATTVLDGFLISALEPKEDITRLIEIVNESGVGKLTRQTTANAIKYNITFGDSNDNSDIQTIMNTFLTDSGLEGIDLNDFGIDSTISGEKISLYFVLQKQADGTYRIVEQNCSISMTIKVSDAGQTKTVKLSADSNYRVNAIGDKVTLPW